MEDTREGNVIAKYSGRKGVVYMSATGTTAAVNVINMNNWSLNMTTDKQEVTSFGDANKTYVQGLKDVTGQISGFWSDNDDSLFDGADSADGVKVYLYPSSDAPTVYFYGPAWVDASITTPIAGPVTVSANIAANGSWSRKP